MNGIFAGLYAGQVSRQVLRAESAAHKSETRAGEVERELRILGERVDKLVLVNMAMWSLLRERTGLTEENLADRVQEIDVRDGSADGKITRKLQQCPNCGRTMSRRHNKCLFCGNDALGDAPFENV